MHEPNVWVCNSFKKDGRRVTSEVDLQKDGRRSTRDIISIRHVKRSGRRFPEKGLEHQMLKLSLRDLASLFRGRRNTSDAWSEEYAKCICISTRPSGLHSTLEGSLAELLRL